MMDAVERIKCPKADDLLNALHPRRGRWPETGRWFFRGHGDAKWTLLPSAHRAESWKLGLTLVRSKPTSDINVDFWERELAYRFLNLLGRAGLPIPREESLPTRFQTDVPWPHPVLEPLLAIAQHNGVPTRLLDWTLSWKVAAYFAAVDALKTGSKALDVWAINERFVGVWGDKAASGVTCRVVRTPRHGNQNLHAQAGVFTLCRGDLRKDDGKFIPLDGLLADIARSAGSPTDMLPCLRRFRMPSSEAITLLNDLRDDEVDAVTLFPGYYGVVRALQEEHLVLRPEDKGFPLRRRTKRRRAGSGKATRKSRNRP
jgi:hypothetical protein